MPADEEKFYDLLKNSLHNCPAHHQFEVTLLTWRLSVSEKELTYDGTEIVITDGHTLPCCFADGFCKPATETP